MRPPGYNNVPREIVEAAKNSEAKYGVPAKVTISQWQIESGGGKHMPRGSNNPFGIKARRGQEGVTAGTDEVIGGNRVHIPQKFAKYGSIQEAFDAHAQLLARNPKYSKAMANKGDPNAFADSLTGVYATDPAYGSKLKAIMARQSVNTLTSVPALPVATKPVQAAISSPVTVMARPQSVKPIAISEAPSVVTPLLSPKGIEQDKSQFQGLVGQDVSDPRIAFLISGGYGGSMRH